ncbi:hypothetical protein ADK47_22915 [Streptomyces rimosus subsp. rimosus]|nr:hypothetical protein ADK78_25785 [Kitasatospora aureofaciens]KOT59475.1 hypothetical protein ADK45_21960 [Streptomyces rimosus subsp. rimosus]KOT75070.1 hypothetical protein ADK47_22915 [Streptomyces rimosus subsp. rimosus]KOT77887.1 hypothetical protein ADK48_23560 [Streptomyces rimosus subsp. rimosus]KUJ32379.1 hypothetical protein ADK46_22810 [Streptomyces rimosus subsp. rimosus]
MAYAVKMQVMGLMRVRFRMLMMVADVWLRSRSAVSGRPAYPEVAAVGQVRGGSDNCGAGCEGFRADAEGLGSGLETYDDRRSWKPALEGRADGLRLFAPAFTGTSGGVPGGAGVRSWVSEEQ